MRHLVSIRLMIVFVVAVGAAIFASSAAADQPTKTSFALTPSFVVTDVCPFRIDVHSTVTGTEIDYRDKSGALTRSFAHIVEQDTFSANGKTLVGIPFTFNLEFRFDASGNVTSVIATGIVEKIPLPDGSLFVSAGWIGFNLHPAGAFLLSPDRGNPGNIAGFCAALAP